MLLMPKLSAILLFSASLMAATDADVVAFLKKGIGNNPNISNLHIDINSKKALPEMKGWQAYFVNIDADVKQGAESRHIAQSGIYFVNGDIIAPELVNIKTGTRLNDTIAPDFNAAFYTKNNLISGDVNSKYKVAIFSDPLCPFCRRYVPETVEYMSKYPSIFGVYYYHFPLVGLHPAAETLTKAAIAAEQNGFEDAVLGLYKVEVNANEKDDQKILDAFNRTLKTKITLADIRNPSVVKQFEFDQQTAQSMMVSGTPTVFFNGQKDPTKMQYKTVKVK